MTRSARWSITNGLYHVLNRGLWCHDPDPAQQSGGLDFSPGSVTVD